jgi:hypothetical protein
MNAPHDTRLKGAAHQLRAPLGAREAFLNNARCDTTNGARGWMLTVSSGTYTIRSNKSG